MRIRWGLGLVRMLPEKVRRVVGRRWRDETRVAVREGSLRVMGVVRFSCLGRGGGVPLRTGPAMVLAVAGEATLSEGGVTG